MMEIYAAKPMRNSMRNAVNGVATTVNSCINRLTMWWIILRSISAGISPCSRLGSIIAASFPSLPTGKINKNEAYLHCSLYLHDDAIRFAVLIITKLQFFWHKVIVIYFTNVPFYRKNEFWLSKHYVDRSINFWYNEPKTNIHISYIIWNHSL